MERKELRLWQSAVAAVLLHLAAAWLLGGPGGVLASWIALSEEELRRLAEESARDSAGPLRFEFIDIPDEPEAPNPEARVASDRSRRARSQPRPADAPAPDNPDPYTRGSTPQKVEYEAAPQAANVPPAPAPAPAAEASEPPAGGGEAQVAESSAEARGAASGEKGAALPGGDPPAGLGREAAGRGRKLSGTRISASEIAEVFDNPGGVAGTQMGRLSFDSAAIDWGPYAREMARAIRRAWLERIPPAFYTGGLRGVVQVSFRIQRDGAVTEISLLDSYGVRPLGDGRAEIGPGIRPFEVTVEETLQEAELPPLPSHFPESSVGVTAAFCYGVACR
jgi:outer membrane biosynthesis protein TonB